LIPRRRGIPGSLDQVLSKSITVKASFQGKKVSGGLFKRFICSGKPKMKIILQADIPSRMELQKVAPLSLLIFTQSWDPKLLEHPILPEIWILKIRHEIKVTTWLRGPTGRPDKPSKPSHHFHGRNTRTIKFMDSNMKYILECNQVDLSQDVNVATGGIKLHPPHY
jgi:hypothetical protein